jgi:NAD(P)-dependent dehydrogenase (short-subunit alcohol dehydrogenase family)
VRLEHQVSLITGAGSGIGRATAVQFAKEGARVVAIDWNTQSVEETRSLIEQAGGICQAMTVDVSQEQQVKDAIATTVKSFGRLDILFNNAGISILKPITETTEAEWDRVLGINLKSVFFGCKHAIPEMVQQGRGIIINTASELAIVAQPLYVAYCASKGGILAMTRALSLEWIKKGIRVNAICPGPIQTPLLQAEFDIAANSAEEKQNAIRSIPFGRLGTPEEIARVVVFLASADAEFIHGTAITVDGGKTAI